MRNNDPQTERCVTLAEYLTENAATVRETAKHFGISKSTVHKDITEKLKNKNRILYEEAQKVLQINKRERHIRGGIATKQKYDSLKRKRALTEN